MNRAGRTGLVFFPALDWAISPTHPEREERLLYTQDQVFEEGLLDLENITEYKPGIATVNDINRVHICVPDSEAVTTESHLVSAGGAITAAERVLRGDADNAFALVRPPGHHAMRVVHGARGFCNINIEAVMVEYIRKHHGHRRIAIVDTDCHHGDGTQDIFWHDPDTLFISMHQDGRTLYPGSGFPRETGGPNARGLTVNIPLPPGTSDEGFLFALNNLIMPILDDFKPDLIINSAGQDNHYSDPITNMNFTARGYAMLTDRLKPQIAVLEGGYSVETALPYINVGIILALAGVDYGFVREPDYDPQRLKQDADVTAYIERLIPALHNQWKEIRSRKESSAAADSFEERKRVIFYDTDNIHEEQIERVRLCDECGGLLTIDSMADTGTRIFAVIVPGRGCEQCRRRGEDMFASTHHGGIYNYLYFQDRDRDIFLRR
ncbi:MAG: histone deacetylase [Syntrophales bacterium]|jgi:acetoin utilization deacetylase AcuC-like enzyme|nr:histone deacetylase [Syntrophales bacterium]MCK9527147.1 histone deacetylase [Syntrophales bacterium]MDX9921728.1 histone deacetylase [Syntrophales bacterium]